MVVTLLDKNIVSYWLIIAGLVIGGGVGAYLSIKVQMTDMPQLVAVLNGSGCGAVCVKPGWFERTVNSLYGRDYACCICSGEDAPCINCRKLRKREQDSDNSAVSTRASL